MMDSACEQLLEQIRALEFSLIELQLFLDTHPADPAALATFNRYAQQLKSLKEIYEQRYGPLTAFTPQYPWRWIEEPWPWQ